MNGKQWAWTVFFGALIVFVLYGIAHNKHGMGFTIADILLIVLYLLQWEYRCRRAGKS